MSLYKDTSPSTPTTRGGRCSPCCIRRVWPWTKSAGSRWLAPSHQQNKTHICILVFCFVFFGGEGAFWPKLGPEPIRTARLDKCCVYHRGTRETLRNIFMAPPKSFGTVSGPRAGGLGNPSKRVRGRSRFGEFLGSRAGGSGKLFQNDCGLPPTSFWTVSRMLGRGIRESFQNDVGAPPQSF